MDRQDINPKPATAGWQAALDAERIRIARVTLPIMIGAGAVFSASYVGIYFAFDRPWQLAWTFFTAVLATGLLLLAYVLVRRGHLAAGVYLAALAINLAVLLAPALLEGSIVMAVLAAFVAIVFARLLASRAQNRVVVLISGLALMTEILLPSFQVFEMLPTPLWLQVVISASVVVLAVVLAALILDARDERYEDSLSQAEAYATELDAQRTVLEERTHDLARRARHLEATAEVARDAASVLEPNELLAQAVTLIRERFGLHRMGIFLLDPAREWAVLRAVSGAEAQRLLDRGFRLRVQGEGIVAHVIRTGKPYLAPDVREDPLYLDDPDVTDTRSEITLPLQAHGEIIGALSAQSTEAHAFDDEDLSVMQILADQMAMAISNARLFQQVQESLEAERQAYGELSREAWAEIVRTRPGLGYRYEEGGVAPLAGQPLSQSERGGDGVERRSELVEELPELALPVRVRGQVIGTINAHKPGDMSEWTAQEIALMETLTEQLSVALESARLYQDTQRRAAREQLSGQVTARMRETLDVDTVLQTAAREMREALGLEEVEVRMGTGLASDKAGLDP
jgi:GAF domain-containing protein